MPRTGSIPNGTAATWRIPMVGGMVSIRLEAEDEFNGTGLAIHKISASAERKTLW